MGKAISKIGFIGTGVMGNAMAGHLIDAGYELGVYNRTKSRCDNLLVQGAEWFCSPEELAAFKPDAIITMLGYPTDVEAIYFGSDEMKGLLEVVDSGTILIDMTTSSPRLAARIAGAAAKSGIRAIDAPVSGGDVGAKSATLTIMVGGERETFEACLPVFEKLGKTITLHGEAGLGQHCKMANQISIAATMLGMAESLAYAKQSGLDPSAVINTISGGSGQTWSLANYGPRVLNNDLKPGFYIKHFIKDLKITLDEASQMNLNLPGTKLALKLYEMLEKEGKDSLGTQAIALLYPIIEES